MCFYTQQGKTPGELTDFYNRDIDDHENVLQSDFINVFNYHNIPIILDNKPDITLPSRKESLFLFENIDDCKYYIDTHKGFGTICEVELIDTVNLFRGDMNLLNETPNYLTFHETINWANRYCKKESSSKPVYEILFQGKCRLIP